MSSRLRSILSVALIVLGAIATLGAVVAIYAHHVVVDRDGFARSVTKAVKEPAVSRELSVRLGDALVDTAPDLVAGERVIEDVAASLISSGTLDPVVRRAALELHDAVLEGKAERLALDLGDGLQLVGSYVAAQDPDLRAQISATVEAKVVELRRSTFLDRVADVGRTIDELAVALPIVALLLFAAAVAVARDRGRAFFRVGIGVAAAAAGLLGLELAADAVVRRRGFASPDAVDQAVGAFTRGIPMLALVLGVAGAAIAAAASGRLTGDTADWALSRTWTFLRRSPERTGLKALRALVLLALGVLLLFEPLLAAQLALVVLGFLVVVEGLTEVVALLGGTARTAAEARGRRRVRLVRAGVVLLGLLAIAGLGALAVARMPESEASIGLACNGSVRLCDRPIDRVAFPAAHNAMSSAEDGFLDPNHRRSLVKHLDAGIRGLLVDSLMARPTTRRSSALTVLDGKVRESAEREVGQGGIDALQDFLARRLARPTGPPEPFLCHIVCELGALRMRDALADVRVWLDRNPRQVLVIVIQDLITPPETERVFRASGLFDHVYTWDVDDPPPTLRQMIDAGRRVLVMAEETGFRDGWYQPGYERLLRETPYDSPTVEALRSDASCRPNRGREGNPLFLVNHWVAVYPPRPSRAAAANERAFLRERVERCSAIRGAFPNLIAVDFAGIGDVVAVAADVNGVAPA